MNARTLAPPPEPPLPVAISECLTGSAVRYDGTDARASFPHAALDGLLSYVPICPEVGIGMAVPRPPIQLVGDPEAPWALGVQDPSVDVTEALCNHAHARSPQLESVYGYLFMERSPSCGLYSVPVHAPAGGEPVSHEGRGVFARAVSNRYPRLPVEENGRLFDSGNRASFLHRVFAYAHWRGLCDAGLTPARLMEFHARYKYLLMAYSVPHYRCAGRLLGNSGRDAWRSAAPADRPEIGIGGLAGTAERYFDCLMQGLGKVATRGGHANVLSHLQGYLRSRLNGGKRRHLAELIEDYRRGAVPLDAPRKLILHHLARYPDSYLANQVYLQRPWFNG